MHNRDHSGTHIYVVAQHTSLTAQFQRSARSRGAYYAHTGSVGRWHSTNPHNQ